MIFPIHVFRPGRRHEKVDEEAGPDESVLRLSRNDRGSRCSVWERLWIVQAQEPDKSIKNPNENEHHGILISAKPVVAEKYQSLQKHQPGIIEMVRYDKHHELFDTWLIHLRKNLQASLFSPCPAWAVARGTPKGGYLV